MGLYSDLRPGQSVVVYDDTGSQVGQGALGSGTVVSSSGSGSYGYSGYGDACRFDYSVAGVAASDSYRVVVGQRNGVVFTSAQAEGHADISVGRLAPVSG